MVVECSKGSVGEAQGPVRALQVAISRLSLEVSMVRCHMGWSTTKYTHNDAHAIDLLSFLQLPGSGALQRLRRLGREPHGPVVLGCAV